MVLKKRKKCRYINNPKLCRVHDKERKCQCSSLVLMHLADAPLDWHFEGLERLVTCFTCFSLCLSSYCVAVGPVILFVETKPSCSKAGDPFESIRDGLCRWSVVIVWLVFWFLLLDSNSWLILLHLEIYISFIFTPPHLHFKHSTWFSF